MFVRPLDQVRLYGDAFASLDRSLRIRCDQVCDVADELIDRLFDVAPVRDGPHERHCLLAHFIERNVYLLAFSGSPRDELMTRVKAALLASKLSEPLHFPPLRQE